MSVVSGDILRFTTFQTYLGEAILNVDFRRYQDTGGSGNTYQDIADQYDLQYRIPTQQFTNSSFTIVRVLVENLTNGLEFLETAIGVSGNRADVGLPSAIAYSVKLLRETKVTRNGGKRLSGVTENSVTNNDVVLQASIIADIEAFWGETLSLGGGAINDFDLEPVIVGRTKNPTTGVYELDLSRVNDVVGASMSLKISTQNTRKPNKGI